jgi:hypothetical protein
MVVRGDRVFGVERDELDIPYVSVHRLVAREGG